MRESIRLATFCIGLLALAAPAARGDEVHEKQGAELFRQFCASCHGPGARGDGPVASVLDPPPADLTTLTKRHGAPLPKAALAELIDGRRQVRAHGSSEMPVWGRRLLESVPPSSGSEAGKTGAILLILDYLESIQRVTD
jgi:mono/diheme cytochrome c family protein